MNRKALIKIIGQHLFDLNLNCVTSHEAEKILDKLLDLGLSFDRGLDIESDITDYLKGEKK